MKKILTASIICFGLILCSYRTTDVKKPLKVEGEIQAWQALIDCLDKSTESHIKVEAVKQWIIPQLQKQIQDTTTNK
jgi:hypothetical protein